MKFLISKGSPASRPAECAPLFIRHDNWGYGTEPEACAQLLYEDGAGFHLHLRCEESEPFRRYTKENDPVYEDSAMEAFFNFFPDLPNSGYINFEMNANGAMLSQYGTGRSDRKFLSDLGIQAPKCTVQVHADFWELSLFIPLTFICEVYGLTDECPQITHIRCNFYKIRESDPGRHYLSFAPIDVPSPDFHTPEFFADGEII